MGNACKSSGKLENDFKCFVERTSYKTADSIQHNHAEHQQNVVRSEVNPLPTSYIQGGREECPSPLLRPMSEFINICTRNRPAGVSDIEWDRFVSTICFECFWIDLQIEMDKKVQVNTPMLATPTRCPTVLSSTKDLMSNSMKEVSGSSTHSEDDLSVDFAARFTVADSLKSDAESTSRWSLRLQSRSKPYAKYYGEICKDDEVRSKNDKELNLSLFSLGDVEFIASEDNGSSYHENKISSNVTSTSTDPEFGVADKVQINVYR